MIKITNIQVENYRSLHNFKMSLHPFTVLVGRNDAGKSNVLRAIQLLLDDDATAEVDRYDWGRAAKMTRYPRQIAITATLDVENRLVVRRRITVNKDSPATSILEVQEGSVWRSPTAEEKQQTPSFYYLRPRTGALQEAFDPSKENNIFTLVKDWMPAALSKEKDLHKLMRGYAPRVTNLMAYVKFFYNEVYAPLKIAFPPDFPLLHLNIDFRTPTDRGRLFVRELTHSAATKALFRLPLSHHGSGLISVVAMVLSIAVLQEYHRQVLNSKPLIAAIEEPEVHLHSRAQRTLLDYLKWTSQKHQVIVTTHSPIFVDRAQPENVVVLRRTTQRDEKDAKKKGTALKAGTTLAIASGYRENWAEITETLGIRLSDALMAGEINLLVEGPSEAILLPAMAEVLADAGQKLLNFDRVFIVQGEGANLPHKACLLQGTGNPTVVIVDNDSEGRRIVKNLPKQDPLLEVFPMPNIETLPPPLNHLKECEFEDLLDSKALLAAFNEAFAGKSGFEFVPLSYDEFEKERMYLFGKGEPFGWVYTVGSLIGKKTTSDELNDKPVSERFSKRILAETAARHVRAGKLPVPPFCQQLFVKINSLLEV